MGLVRPHDMANSIAMNHIRVGYHVIVVYVQFRTLSIITAKINSYNSICGKLVISCSTSSAILTHDVGNL